MAFNIIVCAKQVPDSDLVRIDPKTGSIIRKGVPGVLNADDANALEEALKIKDKHDDVYITVVTMGPPQAEEVLFEAIAKGADEGILINDIALASSDTFVTSTVLKTAIEKWAADNGEISLVFAGREATDGDTAQVGPQLAERLDIPQVTYASSFEISEDMKTVTISRKLEGYHEEVEVNTPCLVTAIKDLNQPRYPHMHNVFAPMKITSWNIEDLGLDADSVGLAGSPSVVISSFPLKKGKGGMFVEGESGAEQAANLLAALKDKRII
ncbi:MAG: electron transfer flavoprotein subunit beta/FixA family protein [Eubacterium sp.]|nr:electron transfer flavoprotein subunit beta/FixA family protein [Candidatus Colimonas fimequi]